MKDAGLDPISERTWSFQPEGESQPGSDLGVQVPWRP